ncbi:phage baseplate assembly protein V [Jeongeupia naejangsanensis]|uniref:Phage baseplate assembly protein n=1 Tax=Jeongeupia naejangsanensis TaxID=613195 RepID=A0ABS2BIS2_9NEIS|nr:phage baseplate assembly protein V [Jeongeupia naejangsanensis]MBM3114998.1 phage baseplate assembly protein [Jeongeupia naejangsanensis]
MIERLARRVRLMVARAVVNLVNDAGGLQLLQVSALADETRDDVERAQNYGLTSVPLPGATVVMVAVAGSRDHLVATAVDDPRYRPTGLKAGEVCVYTNEGDRIHLQNGRLVEISTKTLRINADTLIELNTDKLQINAPLTNSSGQLKTAGDITDTAGSNGRTVAGMRAQYNSHTHGGVQTGPGSSGTPNKGM